MILYFWLVLCNLSLVHLKHSPLVDGNEEYLSLLPKIINNEECNTLYMQLIDDYFARTTIISSNSTDIHYCAKTESWARCARSLPDLEDINLSQLIYLYAALSNVNSYLSNATNNPVTSYGVLSINGTEEIPVYIVANIRRQHLQLSELRPNFGEDVTQQMELMGRLEFDKCEHLLGLTLGGSSTPLNIVPMAHNVNRHLTVDVSSELGIPKAYWKSNEVWIRNFLNNPTYHNGSVAWRIALQYLGDAIVDPSNNDYFRPVRFALQFTAYADYNDPTSVIYESSEITFLNDDDYSCDMEENRIRVTTQILPNCDMHYLKGPRGKMGEITDRGVWNTRHNVSFPFTIDGRQYFYGQSILDGRHWFIQELLPNGRMGKETTHGLLDNNYQVAFPFIIKGRHFFYGHSTSTRAWFIRELLPGGRMGGETDRGVWNTRHAVSFPFKIDGRQYFYAQSILDGRHWFIQELLPNGRMGQEKDHGDWIYNYKVAFPFFIDGRQFFYAHNIESKNWFIQELLPGGKMGKETDKGVWKTRHQVSVPFKIDGKQYFFGQSILDGTNWFIQNLLSNGRMGKETDWSYAWKDTYPVVVPFNIEGKQFLYGKSQNTKQWVIRSVN